MSAQSISAAYFDEDEVSRGTGDKGGQFVTKNSGGSKSSTKTPPARHTTKPAPKKGPAKKPKTPAKPGAKPAVAPARAVRLPSLGPGKANDPQRVRQLQALLSELGLAKLAVDGAYGSQTEAAVKAAQQKLGLKPTGRASNALVRRLSDAHKLSPCVGRSKVTASAAGPVPVGVDEEPDAEYVSTVAGDEYDLVLWSDGTAWATRDGVTLVAEDMVAVTAAFNPGQFRVPGGWAAAAIVAEFNPRQLRDPNGEWGDGVPGANVAGTVRDVLKLAGRINLDDGETLAGSDVVVKAGIPLALTHGPGGAHLRIGTGIADEDLGRWRGADLGSTVVLDQAGMDKLSAGLHEMLAGGVEGRAREKAFQSQIKQLTGQQRALIHKQYPHLSAGQRKELDKLDTDLAELADRIHFATQSLEDSTAGLPPSERAESDRIDAQVAPLVHQWSLTGSPDLKRQIDALRDRQAELHKAREVPGRHAGLDFLARRKMQNLDSETARYFAADARRRQLVGTTPASLSQADSAELARTTTALNAAESDYFDYRDEAELASGAIPGDWGDLVYQTVWTDRGEPRHTIVVRPPNADEDWHPGSEEKESDLSTREVGELLKKVDTLRAAPVTAAAGHDVTPGHDELHHYWTRGEGLAKWADSPTPWTTLVALLTPHVGAAKAKVFASRWFIEVKGYAAGSDKNRVAHGHPPRGHLVGPG